MVVMAAVYGAMGARAAAGQRFENKTVLAYRADVAYSISPKAHLLETPMRSTDLRYHYQPKADRVPQWMRRVWGWF
jgi:hypothetical protein